MVSSLSQANTHQIPPVGSHRSHMNLESKDPHPSLHLPQNPYCQIPIDLSSELTRSFQIGVRTALQGS